MAEATQAIVAPEKFSTRFVVQSARSLPVAVNAKPTKRMVTPADPTISLMSTINLLVARPVKREYKLPLSKQYPDFPFKGSYMGLISPDVASRLKPDFIAVVARIYREMCNLRPGQTVLIISDARTPDYVVATFQGQAQALGASAIRIECAVPIGGATYQPGSKWPEMLVAASKYADLIIDMAVGYAQFIVEAVQRGCRVLCPGDGIGGAFMDDVLIRTVLHTDVHAIRRRADRIADRFSRASHCLMITGDAHDRFELDLSGLDAMAGDGFLWDPDTQDWKTNWAFLPPAQPGVLVPKGRGSGVVNVDGTLLYHPTYHEKPDSPLRLAFRDGRLIDIGGDRVLAANLSNWLDALGDDGARNGPVHLNIGINPNASLTQSQEWERVFGSITCGMGDLSMLGILMGDQAPMLNQSSVHWDWTVLQPKIVLDGETILEAGRLLIE
ncbi:MAG: hypothetical protein JSR95_08325 [Proteobacteria bacterium]|nr:hypothetical protein [Pseudomonadota bacterium]